MYLAFFFKQRMISLSNLEMQTSPRQKIGIMEDLVKRDVKGNRLENFVHYDEERHGRFHTKLTKV